MNPIIDRDPGDETRIREVLHAVDDLLPAPKVDFSGMTRDELWDAISVLSRLMTEATRRRLPQDVFEKLDVARGVTLGLYSTADRAGHSERVA
jgi:hypothetical protein